MSLKPTPDDYFPGAGYKKSTVRESNMKIAQKGGYVQDVRYSGFAGAKTGYVKWRKQQYNAMPKVVSGPCAESTTYLSFNIQANIYCISKNDERTPGSVW
ncbi:MAG: hypothetical protein HW386_994 [Gammaproteobacteria bacterium]|nr:hypothetical protein [Gammaproteobacteria bacterium]